MAHSLGRLAGAAGLLALLPGVAAAGAAQASHQPAAVARAADPNPGVRNFLNGVTALSPTDVWAVGYYCTAHCSVNSESDQTLIEHWDGTAWTQVASPDPGTRINKLSSIAATSDTDAWAVGYYCSVGCGTVSEADRSLIEHWNGTAWTQLPSPGTGYAKLTSVTAVSATDAWAAGYYCKSGCRTLGTLIEHWNGTAWSRVTSPSPGAKPPADVLWGTSATGAGDAWAAGSYCASACETPSEKDKTLIEHWNGAAWSQTASPTPTGSPALEAVSADSPADAWAAGFTDHHRGTSTAVLLHWNGTAWSLVTGPAPGSARLLYGVSAQSPTNAWAVGQYFKSAKGRYLTFILHWDGTAWHQVASPNRGSAGDLAWNDLSQVSADSPTDAWAVGYYCAANCAANSEKDHTLILHWTGTRWSVS